jgi:hypothetical protein
MVIMNTVHQTIHCFTYTYQRRLQSNALSNLRNALRKEGQSIFSNYALSPMDYYEAVCQYERMSLDIEPLSPDERPSRAEIIRRVLYSLDCENVWRREA